jgi:hypothetical protein
VLAAIEAASPKPDCAPAGEAASPLEETVPATLDAPLAAGQTAAAAETSNADVQ